MVHHIHSPMNLLTTQTTRTVNSLTLNYLARKSNSFPPERSRMVCCYIGVKWIKWTRLLHWLCRVMSGREGWVGRRESDEEPQCLSPTLSHCGRVVSVPKTLNEFLDSEADLYWAINQLKKCKVWIKLNWKEEENARGTPLQHSYWF